MNATVLDTLPWFGQVRVDRARALTTRSALSFVDTRGGRVRIRRQPSGHGPRLLFAADGPNVVEHYDDLLRALDGRADVVVVEPPGTGASTAARGFDFRLSSLADACTDVLRTIGPRTLIFPCYTGFLARVVAARDPTLVERLVTPQTPSWEDMGVWADVVDAQRRLRTPGVGQVLMTLRRRSVAAGWYRASTGDKRFRAPFTAAANEAFDVGGCFCLASLMQGLARSAPPPRSVSTPTAVVWGPRDRTHARSDPARSTPGATVVTFAECGHSPELEAPERFAVWLLAWIEGAHKP